MVYRAAQTMTMIRCVAFSFLLTVVSVTVAAQLTEDGVTNVALRKNILLSNTSEYESTLAVDGNTGQTKAKHACIDIETKGDIWWQVDLGDIYTIFNIRVIPTEDFYEFTVGTEEDCYEKLWTYRGHVNTTVSGRTCQRWDSQTPHNHRFPPHELWYRGEDFLADNYCRSPDPGETIPWCYTTDSAVRWEYCDVHVEECKYVLTAELNLTSGTHVNNLVKIDYVEKNDELHPAWEFVLPSATLARYVKLLQTGGDGHYQLCEVEVYGTKEEVRNVALDKSTELSSTLVKGYRPYGSNLAVDGVKDQNMKGLSCFETALGDERPWWRIDLGEVYTIHMIRIYNRMDCCSDRAHDITVLFWTISDEKFELFLEGLIGDIHNFYTKMVARYLELLLSDHGPFHLCEVEVYGKLAQCKSNPCKNGGNCSVIYCDDTNNCRDYTCACPTGYGGADCTVCVENVAIGKDIIASSIHYPSWLTSNVIDGDTNQYVANGATCVSTQRETKPYLIIDLGTEHTLSGVKLYKRLDCCSETDVELFLMVKAWTSYGNTYDSTDTISTFVFDPLVSTMLVRVQAKGQQATVMQLCEIEVFAVCQEGLASNNPIINDKNKPFMQMRFSLSDQYNDVVKSEDSFTKSITQELSIHTGYSLECFKNVHLEKDPFRVSFELHSTDGKLRTLSAMLEKIDKLFKQGITNMETEDGQKLTIIAGSLQYYVMYPGNTGTVLKGHMLAAVCLFVTLMAYL